jgi:hypothetical protein
MIKGMMKNIRDFVSDLGKEINLCVDYFGMVWVLLLGIEYLENWDFRMHVLIFTSGIMFGHHKSVG